MIKEMNGQQYYELIDYGVRNLSIYKDRVNALNVFPVPDGDTGTNMLVTLQSGLNAVGEGEKELSSVSRQFAKAVTFGARGNSGVIISQFFKGLSETFYGLEAIDCEQFVLGLENGVQCAYRAVPQPVEGTILTVVREAAEYVRHSLQSGKVHTMNDLIDQFLHKAKESLDHTPQLLEVLKAAGVVDSGGAGVIYVFEGMEKYLKNEALPESDSGIRQKGQDYSRFNRSSVFEFGYCTELLLQLLDGKDAFDYITFQKEIADYGDSLVTVFEEDKLKLHIHTATPERVLSFCHGYGEFLAVKIENMSVQHEEVYTETAKPYGEGNGFSVVAVAHNQAMKKAFLEMGADHVLLADYQNPPTAADFVDAFGLSLPDAVLVFPNNKNTHLAAIQAQRLCEGKQILVADTRSDAQCYAALPMLDYNAKPGQQLLDQIGQTVDNLDIIMVSQVETSTVFDGQSIQEGDFVAIEDHDLKAVGDTVEAVSTRTIQTILEEKDCEVITLFTGKNTSQDTAQAICDFVAEHYLYTEITVVATDDDFYKVVLSFE